MAAPDLLPLDEMTGRLDRLLAYSPADSIEAAWIEVRRSEVWTGRDGAGPRTPRAGGGARPAPAPRGAGGAREAPAGAAAAPLPSAGERTLWLRVRQSGRTGLHRTGSAEPSELENAVRDALAQARLAPPSPGEPLAGRDGSAGSATAAAGGGTREGGAPALFDADLAALQPARARDLLERAAAPGEQLHMAWLEGRVAVATSAGARRAARVTAVRLTARCGGGAGAGSATAAARGMDALDLGAILERARSRHAPPPDAAPQGPAGPPAGALVVLAEQGAAALIDLLNRHALSAAAMRSGTGWLDGRLDQPVAAACLSLRDDATDPVGLPFPFDLAGWPKRPVDLIAGGVFLTPAVDASLTPKLGRPPTPHAVAPDESIASNLQLLPGGREHAGEELAQMVGDAGEGLWIGALGAVACFDAPRLRFRARALGVRRIAHGRLAEALPDLTWEAGLPEVLAGVRAVGSQPVAIGGRDMLLGAVTAPLLAVSACGTWQ